MSTAVPRRTVASMLIAIFMLVPGVTTLAGALPLLGLYGPVGLAAWRPVVFSLVLLIMAVLFLACAVGLFLVKRWAYAGAIVVNIIYVVLTVIGTLLQTPGLSATTYILAALALIAVLVLSVDNDTKKAFGRA